MGHLLDQVGMEKDMSKDGVPKEDWGYYEDEFGEEEPPDKDSDDYSDYEDYSSKKKKGKGKAKAKGVSEITSDICPSLLEGRIIRKMLAGSCGQSLIFLMQT